jgi:GNAT superfamily N-acetyltransferase
MAIKRLTNTDDAPQLTALLHQAYAADVALGIHFGAATIEQVEVEHHIETTPTFVIEENGDIVATVSVRLPWADNPGPFALPHLGWVATNPKYQHQGRAKHLINWVIEHYVQNELQAPAVSLGTALEHPWLGTAYEKLGFQRVDVVRKFPDHQTLYLVKTLDEGQVARVQDEYLQSVLEERVND